MPDFSLNQPKGSLLLKNNQPKSSNSLLEVVGSMHDKTSPVTNVVSKSATSLEVAKNAAEVKNSSDANKAAAPGEAQVTTDGANTNITAVQQTESTAGTSRQRNGYKNRSVVIIKNLNWVLD